MSGLISPKKDQERLARIYDRFMQGAYLSTKEIAEIEDVSQKTIQNDIRPFILSGILQKDGRRYFMPKEFRNEEILKEAQMSISMMSALFLKAFPEVDTTYLFQKSPKNEDKFYFDFTLEEINDENILSNILYSMEQKVAVEFLYTDRSAKVGKKSIYPLRIANFDGIWYMIGYDLEAEIIKSYHLNDIKELNILEDNFLGAKREKLEQEAKNISSPWYNQLPKRVKLKVEGIARVHIKRRASPNIEILKESDEVLFLSMNYYNSIEVLNFAKEWLPYVSIEDNSELKHQFKKTLQEAISKI